MVYDPSEILLNGSRLLPKTSPSAELRHCWNTKRHCNAEYELHILLRGSCAVDVDDTQFSLHAGDAILIAPGAYHLPTVSPGEFDHFPLVFSPPEGPLAAILAESLHPCRVVHLKESVLSLCDAIYAESSAPGLFSSELTSALYAQLLIAVFRAIPLALPGRHERAPAYPAGIRTGLIDDFFERNFIDGSSEEALARLLHISRRQLTRVLLEHYGMGFREKLLQARMDHAGWLLRTTDKRVSEISSMTGYSSEAAFFKAFREHYGTTPLKYRRDAAHAFPSDHDEKSMKGVMTP